MQIQVLKFQKALFWDSKNNSPIKTKMMTQMNKKK